MTELVTAMTKDEANEEGGEDKSKGAGAPVYAAGRCAARLPLRKRSR